ncbi:hypothetical protein YC2023_107174 [Brassica napus]
MPPLRNRSHPLNSVFFCSGNVSENVRLNERIFLIVSQGINKKAWDASGEHCLFQSKEAMEERLTRNLQHGASKLGETDLSPLSGSINYHRCNHASNLVLTVDIRGGQKTQTEPTKPKLNRTKPNRALYVTQFVHVLLNPNGLVWFRFKPNQTEPNQ